ncbi:hypothetical protein D3C85_1174130 [compost metagenome]
MRVVQGVNDLSHTPADIDRIEHGIGPWDRLVILDVTLRIKRQHRHTITTGHTQGLQGTRQASDPIAEFGIGDATSLITNGSGIWAALKVTV